MKKTLNCVYSMPWSAMLIVLASVGVLIFALTLQYGFDVQPCVLCLWQRVPFVLTTILMLVALATQAHARLLPILFYICAALFAINSGLASFHTGVEQHWWGGTAGCRITPMNAKNIEDLRTAILNTVTAHCDEVNFRILGYSMANWNIPFSFGLAGFSVAAGVLSGLKRS